MKKISVCFLVSILIIITLTSCSVVSFMSYSIDSIKYGEQYADNLADDIMEYIVSGDVEEIEKLFSKEIRTSHNITTEYEQMMKFIDGDIESYDTPEGSVGGASVRNGEYVEKKIRGNITKIITDKGKTYHINYTYYPIYKKDLDYVGMSYICCFCKDEYDEKTGYPDDAKYIIGEVY